MSDETSSGKIFRTAGVPAAELSVRNHLGDLGTSSSGTTAKSCVHR